MRWITFLILLYVMTAFQAGRLGGIPHHDSFWPFIEFLPILAIFYALFAAESAVPLCGLICGMCYDIANHDLIGTQAVPLALVAYLVVRIRLSIFREHGVSQLLITLLAILVFAVFTVTMRLAVHAALEGGGWWSQFWHMAANAVYSAIIAPPLYWVFFRLNPILGFTSHGPRTRIHEPRR